MLWMDSRESPSADDWRNWKSQFRLYERVTIRMEGAQRQGFADDGRRDLFLMFLGPGGQKFLQAQVNDILTENYVNMVAILDAYLDKPTNVHAARHHFRKLEQIPGETVMEFVCQMRQEVAACKFGTIPATQFEDSEMVQQFLAGILDNETRVKLLGEAQAVLNDFR